MYSVYENKKIKDEKFPLFFHTDRIYSIGFLEHNEKNIEHNMQNACYLHWHATIELLRIIRGSARVYIHTDCHIATAGDVVVIASNQIHRIVVEGEACVYDCLEVDPKLCAEWGLSPHSLSYQTVIKDPEIEQLLNKIHAEYFSQKQCYKTVILGYCMELMAFLTRTYSTPCKNIDSTDQKSLSLVRAILQYLPQNIHSQNVLFELSDALQYSPSYLAHLFPQIIGCSIKEYQLQLRFDFAADQLRKSDKSILEIAHLCGYENAASFSAAFKKRYGQTPTEYRKADQITTVLVP